MNRERVARLMRRERRAFPYADRVRVTGASKLDELTFLTYHVHYTSSATERPMTEKRWAIYRDERFLGGGIFD